MLNIILIITLSFLLAITPFLSKILRLPITITEILAGMVIAFLGMPQNGLFDIIAEVGFLYLMFLAGLEINLKNLSKIPKPILNNGYIYHIALYALSILFALILGLDHIFMIIFPLISIGVVMILTREFDKNEAWLKYSLELGIVGEILSIVALTFAAGVMKYDFSLKLLGVMVSLGIALLIIAGAFYTFKILFWWYPELRTWLMPYSDNKGQDLRLSFALFFVMISFMLMLELELVLGAFLAGMLISSFFEHKKELPEKLSSFGFGFLVPLFFIHIGTTIEVSSLMMDGIWAIIFKVLILTIVIRVLSSIVFLEYLGRRETIMFALSQSMPLTLIIAAATVAYHAQSIDKLHYTAFVVAGVLAVVICMSLMKLIDYSRKKYPSSSKKVIK